MRRALVVVALCASVALALAGDTVPQSSCNTQADCDARFPGEGLYCLQFDKEKICTLKCHKRYECADIYLGTADCNFDLGLCQPNVLPIGSNTNKGKVAQLGEFCGGVAGIQCADKLICRLDGDYPDAGGICIDPDKCKYTTCAPGSHCEDGICVLDNPCAAVQCQTGYQCVNGKCVPNFMFENLCENFIWKICDTNKDCPSSHVCLPSGNKCTPSACTCNQFTGEIAECTNDCIKDANLCTPIQVTCNEKKPCGEGLVCNNYGFCERPPVTGPPIVFCDKKEKCPEGYECNRDNICVPVITSLPDKCDSDASCPSGYGCFDYYCQPLVLQNFYCDKFTPCFTGYSCNLKTYQCELLAWSPPASCKYDKDCASGFYCSNTYECLPINPTYFACDAKKQCPLGYYCREQTNYCEPLQSPMCDKTKSCPEGYECNKDTGLCVLLSSNDDIKCDAKKQCPSGYACNPETGFCYPLQSGPIYCDEVKGCPDGYVCNKKTLQCEVYQTPVFCDAEKQCPNGYVCNLNTKVCEVLQQPIDCKDDKFCPSNYFCNKNTWQCELTQPPVIYCDKLRQCPDGYSCGKDDICYYTGPVVGCGNCPPGHICEFGKCIAIEGHLCGGFVKNPFICPAGYHCEFNVKFPDLPGQCVKDKKSGLCDNFLYKVCTADPQCPTGYFCEEQPGCVSSVCGCDEATGQPGICTLDCLTKVGLCKPIVTSCVDDKFCDPGFFCDKGICKKKLTTPNPAKEGEQCGGVAGIPCKEGLTCQLQNNYPDATGECVRNVQKGCKVDSQCPAGYFCNQYEYCELAKPITAPRCNKDCRYGYSCVKGRCIRDITVVVPPNNCDDYSILCVWGFHEECINGKKVCVRDNNCETSKIKCKKGEYADCVNGELKCVKQTTVSICGGPFNIPCDEGYYCKKEKYDFTGIGQCVKLPTIPKPPVSLPGNFPCYKDGDCPPNHNCEIDYEDKAGVCVADKIITLPPPPPTLKCGGFPFVACPFGFECSRLIDDKYATGVCIPKVVSTPNLPKKDCKYLDEVDLKLKFPPVVSFDYNKFGDFVVTVDAPYKKNVAYIVSLVPLTKFDLKDKDLFDPFGCVQLISPDQNKVVLNDKIYVRKRIEYNLNVLNSKCLDASGKGCLSKFLETTTNGYYDLKLQKNCGTVYVYSVFDGYRTSVHNFDFCLNLNRDLYVKNFGVNIPDYDAEFVSATLLPVDEKFDDDKVYLQLSFLTILPIPSGAKSAYLGGIKQIAFGNSNIKLDLVNIPKCDDKFNGGKYKDSCVQLWILESKPRSEFIDFSGHYEFKFTEYYEDGKLAALNKQEYPRVGLDLYLQNFPEYKGKTSKFAVNVDFFKDEELTKPIKSCKPGDTVYGFAFVECDDDLDVDDYELEIRNAWVCKVNDKFKNKYKPLFNPKKNEFGCITANPYIPDDSTVQIVKGGNPWQEKGKKFQTVIRSDPKSPFNFVGKSIIGKSFVLYIDSLPGGDKAEYFIHVEAYLVPKVKKYGGAGRRLAMETSADAPGVEPGIASLVVSTTADEDGDSASSSSGLSPLTIGLVCAGAAMCVALIVAAVVIMKRRKAAAATDAAAPAAAN